MNKNESIASERYSKDSWLPPWTIKEHHARYNFASNYVAGKVVLDCACGSGESSQIFAKAGASRVIGIDVDAGAVESARSKYIEPGLEFCLGNGREIPIGDSLVDVFVCLETIEHVKEDKSFLDEVWRVLRPDGLLICSTPNRDVTNPDTVLEDTPWNHFHIREYNEVDFKQLIRNRFKIVECFGQNPVHPIIYRSSRMIAKILGTRIAVKFNQGLKCRWFLFDAKKLHEVQKSYRSMEYFVWVMQK